MSGINKLFLYSLFIVLEMSRKVYSTDIRQKIVEMFGRNVNQKSISELLDIPKSVVSRIIKRYQERGSVETAHRSGRPRKSSLRDDIRVFRTIKSNPFLSARQIQQEVLPTVSSRTIQRRLVEKGMLSRRPAKKPLLKARHRQARLEFAQQHQHWTISQWRNVLFSDESKFDLFKSDGMCRVRRPKGQRLNPRYYKPTVKHGGGSVMVWGCFSGHGVGPINRIEGIMDRFVYKDILKDVMLPYAEWEMPLLWSFQHDNDPKHASKIVKDFLQESQISVLKWPSQSPDINPIENLWEILDRKIRNLNTYSNKASLYDAIVNAWNSIPRETIDALINSMPRRCAEIIKNKGYAIKY